jgi:hypothetical protein
VDATIMEVPRQRNRPDENDQIKQGQRPASFDENPARGRQKDTDARWSRLSRWCLSQGSACNGPRSTGLQRLIDTVEAAARVLLALPAVVNVVAIRSSADGDGIGDFMLLS